MQHPFCLFSAAFLCSRCLAEWAPGVSGSSNRSQKANPALLCGSISPRSVVLTTVQAFNTTPNLLLTQKGVCVSVYFFSLCVSLCLQSGYRQELSSLQLSQRDVNIYDTLFAIWCELFLLQTSASDICTFSLHYQALWIRTRATSILICFQFRYFRNNLSYSY